MSIPSLPLNVAEAVPSVTFFIQETCMTGDARGVPGLDTNCSNLIFPGVSVSLMASAESIILITFPAKSLNGEATDLLLA